MDGMERFAHSTDHDLLIITVTKLEGLEKKVGEYTDGFREQNRELEQSDTAIKVCAEALSLRVGAMEAVKSTTTWMMGGLGGAVVVLVGVILALFLGG